MLGHLAIRSYIARAIPLLEAMARETEVIPVGA
jgi:hypothetical protein